MCCFDNVTEIINFTWIMISFYASTPGSLYLPTSKVLTSLLVLIFGKQFGRVALNSFLAIKWVIRNQSSIAWTLEKRIRTLKVHVIVLLQYGCFINLTFIDAENTSQVSSATFTKSSLKKTSTYLAVRLQKGF